MIKMKLCLKNVKQKIKTYKKRLERKCQKYGIYEDFGQNEIRELESWCTDAVIGSELYKKINPYIEAFKSWCSNYRG